MYKLVKDNDTTTRAHNESYNIKNYLTREFSKDFSLAVSQMDGSHEPTKSVASDRIYYFIKGRATFTIDGTQIDVAKDDVLFIEKNTEYSFRGKFRAVLVNLPAFGIENDRNKL